MDQKQAGTGKSGRSCLIVDQYVTLFLFVTGPNGTYLSQNVGWVSVFCVTRQVLHRNSNCFFNECLTARSVGYGAKNTPNPPYIG